MVTIDILGSIEKFMVDALKLIAMNILIVILLVTYPVVMIALPLYLISVSPSADRNWLMQLIFWTAPLSCAFYMCVSCHWHSVHQWRKMGRLDEWREEHGGIFHTVFKSFVYMGIGLVASYICEVAFLLAFSLVPHSVPMREALGFVLYPWAVYAPVIVLWISRRNYHEPLPGEEFGVVYPDAGASR